MKQTEREKEKDREREREREREKERERVRERESKSEGEIYAHDTIKTCLDSGCMDGGGGGGWGGGMYGVLWGLPCFPFPAAERSRRCCPRVIRKAPRACGWGCSRRHPAKRKTERRKHKVKVRSESVICRTGQFIFTMTSVEMRRGANDRYMLRYVFCTSEVNNCSCGLMDKAAPS